MENFAVRLIASTGSPLYRQLYEYIVSGIQRGEIRQGEKLPSKRTLAGNLNVSVNTIDTAYQMLAAEGYIESKPKSGFIVLKTERLDQSLRVPVVQIAETKEPEKELLADFSTESVDVTLFPYKTWGRIQRSILTSYPEYLNRGVKEGDFELRLAIARHLHEYRGVVCSAEQIIVGAGTEYLLGLLSCIFADKVFALENPGYPRVDDILKNHKAKHLFIQVDRDGLVVSALSKTNADIVYITPSHQFPTGAVMPIGRRQELLAWAGESEGRYIIEDDYDSEFRFDVRPLPSLQGLDGTGRVIYLSTFSRCLSPSIRIAYMVLPENLLPMYRSYFARYSSTVSRFDQHTLQQFINDGHFARHLNRARIAYRARRNCLIRELTASLGWNDIAISGEHTGLHLLLRINIGMSEAELTLRARSAGVKVTGLSEYCRPDTDIPESTLVFGYAALNDSQISDSCVALKKVWELKNKTQSLVSNSIIKSPSVGAASR